MIFKKNKRFFLVVILLFAFILRFNNLNWDEGFHLHPDERFLTMVGNAMTLPSTFSQYLDPHTSTLNPPNVGFGFYVYGVFPIVFNKLVAVFFGNDSYNAFTLQGRAISALLDGLTVIMVYKIAKLLFKEKDSWVPLWSAFLYAIAVLPIQLSHFFAVDTFLNFFMLTSFYFALRANQVSLTKEETLKPRLAKEIVLSAVFFALALSSKVTALFILPLNFFLIGSPFVSHVFTLLNYRKKEDIHIIRIALALFLTVFVYCTVSYAIVRLANPYYFENPNFFNMIPNALFVENLKTLQSFNNRDTVFPPSVQWLSKSPGIFSLVNVAVFGLGLPIFISVLIGLLSFVKTFFRSSKKINVISAPLSVSIVWMIGFFLYQSFQFAQSLRYFIIIYPFLAIVGGMGVSVILNFLIKKSFPYAIRYFIVVLIFLTLLIGPLAFSSIYIRKNSRVAASEWIYKNVPSGALILSEHWDDGLPLPVPETYGKQYSYEQLPIFDPDTDEKWTVMNNLLERGDYYILSSNRGWGSIPTVPQNYPRMSRFYQDLFDDKTDYKQIAEFTSYPSLKYLGIPFDFDDQWSEEAFTVYDHPKVIIFRKK